MRIPKSVRFPRYLGRANIVTSMANTTGVGFLFGGDPGFESCPKATQVAFIDQFKNWSIPLSDFLVPRKGKSDACESRSLSVSLAVSVGRT